MQNSKICNNCLTNRVHIPTSRTSFLKNPPLFHFHNIANKHTNNITLLHSCSTLKSEFKSLLTHIKWKSNVIDKNIMTASPSRNKKYLLFSPHYCLPLHPLSFSSSSLWFFHSFWFWFFFVFFLSLFLKYQLYVKQHVRCDEKKAEYCSHLNTPFCIHFCTIELYLGRNDWMKWMNGTLSEL